MLLASRRDSSYCTHWFISFATIISTWGCRLDCHAINLRLLAIEAGLRAGRGEAVKAVCAPPRGWPPRSKHSRFRNCIYLLPEFGNREQKAVFWYAALRLMGWMIDFFHQRLHFVVLHGGQSLNPYLRRQPHEEHFVISAPARITLVDNPIGAWKGLYPQLQRCPLNTI
jgi:hypothetical protein